MCNSPRKTPLLMQQWGFLAFLLPFLYQCSPTQTYTKTTKGFRPLRGVAKAALRTPSKGRRLALIIGINKYQDKTWHPLRFAAKDAQDVASVLRSQQLGRFDHLFLQVKQKETTRQSILAAFARLKALSRSRQDTIFVYISAHGTLARDAKYRLRRYLVTHDTKSKDVTKTAIAVERLRHAFAQLKSRKKVMLLATCHSGSGKSRLNQHMLSELKTLKSPFFVKPIETVSRATMFLGVCGFGETAQESPKLKNDIYTHYFLKALRNRYDVNGDGAITVSEAHDFARELTYHHTHGRQRAYAESDILGADPIILVGKKKRLGKPVLYAYNQRYFGVEVRVNGTTKGAFPRSVKVAPGKQHITLSSREGGKRKVLFAGNVQFRPGERLEVSKLFKRKVYNFSIAVTGGYQFFIDGSSEDRMSRPLPLVGLDLKWKRPFKLPLDLRFEFAFGRNSHVLQEQDNRPQTVTELNFGLALTYSRRVGRFAIFAGPRLSAIYLMRESNVHKNLNDFFYSFQPGLLAGGEFFLHPRWSLFAQARLNYTYVTMEDGSARHQGSYELLGGLYFHF